jgi:ABC-2 type transport system permease protein
VLSILKLIQKYLLVSLRSQMQYRTSTLMTMIAQLVFSFSDFAGILVLFQRFNNLHGWRVWEVEFHYSIINISFACGEIFARGFEPLRTRELESC